METTINTIADFKKAAKMTHNNAKSAGEAWMRGWGWGTTWEQRWAYKEYTYVSTKNTYQYRTGTVSKRHGHYSVVRFYVNSVDVTRKKFFEELNKEQN